LTINKIKENQKIFTKRRNTKNGVKRKVNRETTGCSEICNEIPKRLNNKKTSEIKNQKVFPGSVQFKNVKKK
jgi:hypothetical protein